MTHVYLAKIKTNSKMTNQVSNFLSMFPAENVRKQYAENAIQMRKMLNKSILTRKKVNGYTSDQLTEMVSRYEDLSNNYRK